MMASTQFSSHDEYKSHTDASGFQAHPDDNDDVGGYQPHSEKGEHRSGFQPEKKEWLNKVPGFIPLFGIGPIIMERQGKDKLEKKFNFIKPNNLEKTEGLIYEPAPYHGKDDQGGKNKGPEHGQESLEYSKQIKESSSRRIGVDFENKEIIIHHVSGKDRGVFHGHVRDWGANGLSRTDLQKRSKSILVAI